MTSKRLTPIQSIKKYCKESCCAGDLKSWKNCSVVCVLKPYSLGKRPKKKPFSEYMNPKSSKEKHTEKRAVLTSNSIKNDDSQEVRG